MTREIYDSDAFGENLKCLRKRRGFTIELFAEIIEVSPRMVRYWEAGQNYPRLYMFDKICKVLGTTPNSILEV
jgi:transcriptional regulator with XRE-family HTH domain